MRLEKPPHLEEAIGMEVFPDLMSRKYEDFLKLSDKHYYYWDELKYKKSRPYENAVKSWSLVKIHRQLNFKHIWLGNYQFHYYTTNDIARNLHEFDLKLMGGLYRNPITPEDQTAYLKNSLLEEAIASSQIEGAATTTKVARQMLKSGRTPKNESEQMIFNNRRGISFILEHPKEELTPAFIIELHRIMTANTSAADGAGSFRDDSVYVTDHVDGDVAHIPPDHLEVEPLINELCRFVMSEQDFIHPVLKASILHFFIGWIHPFKDGNGRTARALFYWYLIKKGYGIIRNISISRAILDSRLQYDKSYLKTEQDNNDLTYFIIYAIKSLRVAFESLIDYRNKKKKEKEKEQYLSQLLMESGFDRRQAELIAYLYVKEDAIVNISGYAKKHGVVRQTASKDLKLLVDKGILRENKFGREVHFSLPEKRAVVQLIQKIKPDFIG